MVGRGILDRIRSLRLPPLFLAFSMIAIGVILVHVDFFRLGRPVNWDHNVHFTHAWLFKERLISGQLWTWSNQFFEGYPTDIFYAPGTNLLITGIYGLGFGVMSFDAAYIAAYLFTLIFLGTSIFLLFRHFLPNVGAFFLAALTLLDPGDVYQGGWYFTAYVGVWPLLLGLGFGLCSTHFLWEKKYPAYSLCLFLGVICHPSQLAYHALMLAALCLSHPKRWDYKELTLFTTLGLLMTSFWLLPISYLADYVDKLGKPGYELLKLPVLLWNNELLTNIWSPMVPLGLVGIGYGLLDPSKKSRMISTFCILTFLASSNLPDQVFHLFTDELLSDIVEFPRLISLLRPFFLAAGIAVISRMLHWTKSFRWWKPLALLLSIAFVTHNAVNNEGFHRKKSGYDYRSSEEIRNRHLLVQWLNQKYESEGFFRLAHGFGDTHQYLDLALSVNAPLFKVTFTPALTYGPVPKGTSSHLFSRLGVRYGVSDYALRLPHLKKLIKIGKTIIYEHQPTDANSEYNIPPPIDLETGLPTDRYQRPTVVVIGILTSLLSMLIFATILAWRHKVRIYPKRSPIA